MRTYSITNERGNAEVEEHLFDVNKKEAFGTLFQSCQIWWDSFLQFHGSGCQDAISWFLFHIEAFSNAGYII
jgi:hypothetical protein